MAEKALQKVEEDLNCLVCLGVFTDPKLLQCHHVFCSGCLEGLVRQDQFNMPCPTCRKVTPIPANGIAGLQSAFHINHLLDILKEHKKATGGIRYCPEHPTRELESFCETCDKLICLECVLFQHRSHECNLVRMLFGKYVEEIKALLEPVESCFQITSKALDELNARDREILEQRNNMELKICTHTRKIQEAAEARKIELINKVRQITEAKLQDLASQRAEIETTMAQLGSYLNTVRKSLETSSQGEVVTMKTYVKQQAKELAESFQPDTLKLEVVADMKISKAPNAIEVCQSFWDVFALGSPDPAQCRATGKGLEVATVEETTTVIFHPTGYDGTVCKKMIESLTCELVSELTRERVSGSVGRNGQNQYEISYQPTIKGKHLLHIKISDQHIPGSPFGVVVKLPVDKLGNSILTFSSKACAIAINPKRELLITEKSHRVNIYSPNGERYNSFGTKGSLDGQFDCPIGVTVDGADNILVADTQNYRIQQFTAEGQFIKSVGSKGNEPLQFEKLADIAYSDSTGKIYVVDSNRVHILNSDLTFFYTFGWHGGGMGKFDEPCGIACDSTGNVYVADTDNNRIQVFTAEGSFLRMFGQAGEPKEQLNLPYGIAVDASDMVYVTQPYKHRVSVFTCEGQFVTSFSTKLKGEEEKEMGPVGIAVDNLGLVYVCDLGTSKVKIF